MPVGVGMPAEVLRSALRLLELIFAVLQVDYKYVQRREYGT